VLTLKGVRPMRQRQEKSLVRRVKRPTRGKSERMRGKKQERVGTGGTRAGTDCGVYAGRDSIR